MKILYISILGKAGGDIYFQRLHEGFKKYTNIKTDLIFIPHFFEIIPILIPLYIKIKKLDLRQYDIIHTNAEFGRFFKNKGKPLFVTMHHITLAEQYLKYNSLLQKLFHRFWVKPNLSKTLKIVDKVIAVSNYTKNQIMKHFKINPFKIIVIYNGIDVEEFRPINLINVKRKNNNKIKLLFVGNLTKRKGADLLPKIIDKLGDKYILYYTSGLRTRDIIPEQRNMISLGKLTQKELVKAYNKCDILLFPTRLEGFGYVVAEAMACGKPVVTTNCSSLPELVENEKNGFLCEMDSVEDFVEKIRILRENKSLREMMGEYNRKKVLEKFSLKEMIKKYVEIYKSTIQN